MLVVKVKVGGRGRLLRSLKGRYGDIVLEELRHNWFLIWSFEEVKKVVSIV